MRFGASTLLIGTQRKKRIRSNLHVTATWLSVNVNGVRSNCPVCDGVILMAAKASSISSSRNFNAEEEQEAEYFTVEKFEWQHSKMTWLCHLVFRPACSSHMYSGWYFDNMDGASITWTVLQLRERCVDHVKTPPLNHQTGSMRIKPPREVVWFRTGFDSHSPNRFRCRRDEFGFAPRLHLWIRIDAHCFC